MYDYLALASFVNLMR